MSGDDVGVVTVLWGDAGGPVEQELRDAGVSSRALAAAGVATPGLGEVLDHRLSGALRAAVDVDLGAVLVGAWTGYHALRDAAARTWSAPGTREDVTLAEHEITSVHQPLVDVLVDGAVRLRLTFELVLTVTVRSVVAEVAAGRLVAVRGGQAVVTAGLALDGTTLAAGERTWLPGVVVRLGDGVPLVAAAAVPHPAPPAPPQPGAPWWEHATPAAGSTWAGPGRW